MLKHIGKLTNTGKKVVVVFMQLPGDDRHALVIDTDALPDNFNDSIRRLVESHEGQQAKDFGELLGRTPSPDGSNTTLLQKMHLAQRLQKVPIEDVSMTPLPNVNWPLVDVIKAINEDANKAVDLTGLSPEERAQVTANIGKFNIHAANQEAQNAEGSKDQAQNLIRMAELLEADAIAKREQAYRLDPTLVKPVKVKVKDVPLPPKVKVDTSSPVVSKPKQPPKRKPGMKQLRG